MPKKKRLPAKPIAEFSEEYRTNDPAAKILCAYALSVAVHQQFENRKEAIKELKKFIEQSEAYVVFWLSKRVSFALAKRAAEAAKQPNGTITFAHVRELSRIGRKPEQEKVLTMAIKERLSAKNLKIHIEESDLGTKASFQPTKLIGTIQRQLKQLDKSLGECEGLGAAMQTVKPAYRKEALASLKEVARQLNEVAPKINTAKKQVKEAREELEKMTDSVAS